MVPTLKERNPDSDSFIFDRVSIYVVVLLCSALKGMGGSIFWVGGLSYVRECSNEENKSLYFSFLYSFQSASHLVGSLMSAFILGLTTKLTYFITMCGVSILAFILFLFLRVPDKHVYEVSEGAGPEEEEELRLS